MGGGGDNGLLFDCPVMANGWPVTWKAGIRCQATSLPAGPWLGRRHNLGGIESRGVNWTRTLNNREKHPSLEQTNQQQHQEITNPPTWAPATQYVHPPSKLPNQTANSTLQQLDRFVGLAMLILASTDFAYYTVWTLLMVCSTQSIKRNQNPNLARNKEQRVKREQIAGQQLTPSNSHLSTTPTSSNLFTLPASGPFASPSSSFCSAAGSLEAS